MKICPNCKQLIEDQYSVCKFCGSDVPNAAAPQAQYQEPQQQNPQYAQYSPYTQNTYQRHIPQYDHTDEFDPKDISDNKVFAILVYLAGIIGIIIAMLNKDSSEYTAFHVRQAIKFMILEACIGIAMVVLIILCFIPILGLLFILVNLLLGLSFGVIFVIKIIAVFSIFAGKAEEPFIIRSLRFLK